MKTSTILIVSIFTCMSAAAQMRFATLYTFADGAAGRLTAVGGTIYGAFSGSTPIGSTCGGIFELQPPTSSHGESWTETVLYSFADTNDGCGPSGVVPGGGGVLYGLTDQGGVYGYGTLFELEPPTSPGGAWTERILYSFGPFGADIGSAGNNLIAGPEGSFYFVSAGGANGYGALIQMRSPPTSGGAWTSTVVYSSTEPTPVNSLTSSLRGVLYGTTAFGESTPGALGRVSN